MAGLRSRTGGSMNDEETASREGPSAPPKNSGQKSRRSRNRKLRRKSSSNSQTNPSEDVVSQRDAASTKDGKDVDLADTADSISLAFK